MDGGERLGRFGTDRIYLLIQVLIYGGIGYIVWFGASEASNLPKWWYLVAWALAYVLIVVAFENIRPRFDIHETGIVVTQNQKRDFWRWDQLVRYDGVRTNFYVNGIPAMRTGANHFYTGKGDVAFSVGALTSGANIFVSYIIAKWIQDRSQADILRLREEAVAFTFDKITLDKTGISTKKHAFRWDEIERLEFRYGWNHDHAVVFVSPKAGGRSIKLGKLEGVALYTFMVLVDALLHTDYLSEARRELLRWQKRWLRQTWILAKIIGIFAIVLMAIVGVALVVERLK